METLNHSSSQAGFAIVDAVLGQQTTAIAGLLRGFAMRQNSQMAAARGIIQRFLKYLHPLLAIVFIFIGNLL